jgi:hypothetical protein
MKQKLVAVAVYLVTSLALALYFESLFGAGPVTLRPQLLIGIVGAILFVPALVLSIFELRLGVMCGLAASALSWSCLGDVLVSIPWESILRILPYARWADILVAIVMLIISSIYSLAQLRLFFKTQRPVAQCTA